MRLPLLIRGKQGLSADKQCAYARAEMRITAARESYHDQVHHEVLASVMGGARKAWLWVCKERKAWLWEMKGQGRASDGWWGGLQGGMCSLLPGLWGRPLSAAGATEVKILSDTGGRCSRV